MALNRCVIDTRLGPQARTSNPGDISPLLLSEIRGAEALSAPFAFDLTLLRTFASEDVSRIKPTQLIDTPARIGIRKDGESHFFRAGIIESFARRQVYVVNEHDKTEEFVTYKASLVPAFKRLSCETAFRVFTDKRLDSIMEEIFDGFPNLHFSQYVRPLNFHWPDLPNLPYAVQFGETSFHFLSRLMVSLGIWYYFDFSRAQDQERWSPGDPAQTEQLVLGRGPGLINSFQPCLNPMLNIDAAEPSDHAVGRFGIDWASAPKQRRVGEFNPLIPTRPLAGKSQLGAAFDLDPAAGGAASAHPPRFHSEAFPAESYLWHAAGPLGRLDANDDANSRMRQSESRVYTARGTTKNATFVTGGKFYISEDESTDDEDVRFEPNGYLINTQSIYAYESCYGHHFWSDVMLFIRSVIDFINPFSEDNQVSEVATHVAEEGLHDALADRLNDPHSNLIKSFGIGAFTTITSAVSGVREAIERVINAHRDDFSTAFTALTWPDNVAAAIPLPTPTKPRAVGPHLATVIGDDGVDTTHGDISVDALGRVRIRFPWDPSPPAAGAKGNAQVEPQFLHGRNTCWVRVSESWAGQTDGAIHGSQFLPRVGDEVLVDFVAGDPERPIITGRLYNAAAKPPFPTTAAADFSATPAYWLNPASGPGYGANTRSGFRTRNTMKPKDGAEGFHLLRFEDFYDSPQLLLRSQGRYDVTAFCSRFETTYANRYVKVAPTPKTARHPGFGGNSFTTIAGACDIHVGGSRIEQVEKDENLTVKGDTIFNLEGNFAATVGKTLTLNADTIVMEASKKISLKVGGSSVVLTPCGVYIDGCTVYVNCGGSPETAADQTIAAPADAKIADDGSSNTPAADDCAGGGGGGHGGGSGSHELPAKHAPATVNCGDTICIDPAGEAVCRP